MKTILVSLMVLAGATLLARAALVDANITQGYGSKVTTTTQGSIAFAGQYILSYGDNKSFTAYNIDTYEINFSGPYEFYVNALSEHDTPAGLQQVDYLYKTYGSVSSNTEAAALQAAIWACLYGTLGFDVWDPSDGETKTVASTDVDQLAIYRKYFEYWTEASTVSSFYDSALWKAQAGGTLPVLVSSPVPEFKYFGLISALFLIGITGWELRRRSIATRRQP